MHAPIKYAEKGLSIAANGLWQVFSQLNKISPNPSMTPRWSDKPLLKSHQKTKPPLGWPRQTDSLCPTCVREARQAILDGTRPLETLLNEKVGEIKATIDEKDGKIVMLKVPIHGHFEDTMRSTPRSSSTSKRCSPGATSARTTTRSFTTTAAAPSSTAVARC